MNKREKMRIQQAAIHEAGHAVMYLCDGLRVDVVCVSWTGEGVTNVQYTHQYAVSMIAQCLIGAVSEADGEKIGIGFIDELQNNDSDIATLKRYLGWDTITLEDVGVLVEKLKLAEWRREHEDAILALAMILADSGMLNFSRLDDFWHDVCENNRDEGEDDFKPFHEWIVDKYKEEGRNMTATEIFMSLAPIGTEDDFRERMGYTIDGLKKMMQMPEKA